MGVHCCLCEPQPQHQEALVGKLDDIEVSQPWVIAGDFNCVLADGERSFKSRASSRFQNWFRGHDLIDLGFLGNNYTWSHGSNMETRRIARMDHYAVMYGRGYS